MNKIIDTRMVVPYKSFLKLPQFAQYNAAPVVKWRRNLRKEDAKSAQEKSIEQLIREMDEVNIVKACTFIRTNATVTNDDLLSLLSEHPDRFVGVPHIDLTDTQEALSAVKKYVIDGPCTAIYLEPGFRLSKVLMHGDDERIFPIYELCETQSIPVLLQYGGGVNKTDYYKPESIDHIMETFPKLNLAITHGGWPQVMAFCQLAYRHNGVYLIPDGYFTKMPGSYDFQLGANGILQDKIMFGSVYPGSTLKEAVTEYQNVGLHDDIYEKVMYKNAARFFKIEEDKEFVYADGHTGFTK